MRVEPATSPAQLDLLEHALGLNRVTAAQRQRYSTLQRCFRNFIVGVRDSAAWPDLLQLEARGLVRRADTTCSMRTSMFTVTQAGFDVLRAHGRVPAVQLDLFTQRGMNAV